LFEQLWLRLPLASKSPNDFDESEDVARCFVKSHQRLSQMADEATTLLETLCRFHVQSVRDKQIDPGKQQEREEAKIRECMDVAMPMVGLGAELDVSTVAQGPEAAFERLTKSLRRSTRELVESLFSALEHLVDKQVVGLIEWPTESLCKFHFFRRVLIHVFEGQTAKEHVREYWRTVGGREMVRTETTRNTTTKGRDVHQLVRYEQQLMKASPRRLDTAELVVPLEVQRVLAAIPGWLSPFVRVAVGECFRERIIRHSEKTEQWEDSETSQQVDERPASYYDPAVTIGEFVLVGWGEREHDLEVQRRIAVEDARKSLEKARDALIMSALLCAAGIALVVGASLIGPSWGRIGWVGMIASLLPFNVGMVRYGRSLETEVSRGLLVYANLTAILSCLVAVSVWVAVSSRALLPIVVAAILIGLLIRVGSSTRSGFRSLTSSLVKE
jgi:hypothetical protein